MSDDKPTTTGRRRRRRRPRARDGGESSSIAPERQSPSGEGASERSGSGNRSGGKGRGFGPTGERRRHQRPASSRDQAGRGKQGGERPGTRPDDRDAGGEGDAPGRRQRKRQRRPTSSRPGQSGQSADASSPTTESASASASGPSSDEGPRRGRGRRSGARRRRRGDRQAAGGEPSPKPSKTWSSKGREDRGGSNDRDDGATHDSHAASDGRKGGEGGDQGRVQEWIPAVPESAPHGDTLVGIDDSLPPPPDWASFNEALNAEHGDPVRAQFANATDIPAESPNATGANDISRAEARTLDSAASAGAGGPQVVAHTANADGTGLDHVHAKTSLPPWALSEPSIDDPDPVTWDLDFAHDLAPNGSVDATAEVDDIPLANDASDNAVEAASADVTAPDVAAPDEDASTTNVPSPLAVSPVSSEARSGTHSGPSAEDEIASDLGAEDSIDSAAIDSAAIDSAAIDSAAVDSGTIDDVVDPADEARAAALSTPVRNIVGIKFTNAGRITPYDAIDKIYARGQEVVVETERGPRIGIVAVASKRQAHAQVGNLRKVLRRPTANDRRRIEHLDQRGKNALRVARETARTLDLAIKVFRAEYPFSGKKVVIYFTADERVDFREMVRTLTQTLRCRVEMRQTGVRDEAKVVGGIGSCGQTLCCTTWLPEFVPVSIKMAKDQGLVLNPTKVSGQCGRLKCCLVYEQETYAKMRKGLPKLGKRVITESGQGRVTEVDVLRQRVRVSLVSGESHVFPAHEVRSMFPSRSPQKPTRNK